MALVLPFFCYIFHLFIELHQEFSGCKIWSVTLIHVPICDSVSDREVYFSMPWTRPYPDYYIAALFFFNPGLATVQWIKPGCAEQAKSSHACSIILDFFILLLRNTPLEKERIRRNPQYNKKPWALVPAAIAVRASAQCDCPMALVILNSRMYVYGKYHGVWWKQVREYV